MVALEIACRQRGDVRLLIEHEIPLPAATCNQRAPFQWTVTGSGKEKLGVIPDRVFALESGDKGERILCFLEADRGTMPVGRAKHDASSIARKLHTPHLGNRPVTMLHGDLLPQNLLWDFHNEGGISVIDWESARIGDPAYDLSIVTRGARQPLQESGILARLLAVYNEANGASLSASAVQIHELLMQLRWLGDAARAEAAGTLEGHGPEQHAQKIQSMLRRFHGAERAPRTDE